ncbi:MAG: hypothetical protein ACK4GT_00125 [Pararhodobacter sp.]
MLAGPFVIGKSGRTGFSHDETPNSGDRIMSKMRIAFPRGGRIPAGIAGKEEKKCGPHEPVTVPAEYGRHVVEDRFAYEVKGRSSAKAATETRGAAEIARLEKAVRDADEALANAEGDEAKALAEAALKDAQAELAAAQS